MIARCASVLQLKIELVCSAVMTKCRMRWVKGQTNHSR